MKLGTASVLNNSQYPFTLHKRKRDLDQSETVTVCMKIVKTPMTTLDTASSAETYMKSNILSAFTALGRIATFK